VHQPITAGKEGHKSADCVDGAAATSPAKASYSTSTTATPLDKAGWKSSGKAPLCFKCHQAGHRADSCPTVCACVQYLKNTLTCGWCSYANWTNLRF